MFVILLLSNFHYPFIMKDILTSFMIFSISEYNSGLAETLKLVVPAKRLL